MFSALETHNCADKKKEGTLDATTTITAGQRNGSSMVVLPSTTTSTQESASSSASSVVMEAMVVVNRIPSTASSRKQRNNNNKRRHSFGSKQSGVSQDGSSSSSHASSNGIQPHGGQHHRRKQQYYPASPKRQCAGAATATMPMEDVEEVFDKLDPNQPDHARRIYQRRKAIAKGKNTAGYQHYVVQVPKNQRQPRSMRTPSTPDPSLDIPAKRWQGLVKAWRIALHDYDPPELVAGTAAAATVAASGGAVPGGDTRATIDAPTTPEKAAEEGAAVSRVRALELERAAAMGLVVGDSSPGTLVLHDDDAASPISVWSETSHHLPSSRRSGDEHGDSCVAGVDQGTALASHHHRPAAARWLWGDDDDSDDDDLL